MHPRPVEGSALAGLLADVVESVGDHRLRVAVAGASVAGTAAVADGLADELTSRSRFAVRISTADFLRPAAERLEHGRTDLIDYRDNWIDLGALRREVLAAFTSGETGRYLPTLRDPVTDRATRAEYRDAPAGAVVVVDGPLLLDHADDFDVTVAVHIPAAALTARTPAEWQWTLPAQLDADRASADVVIRATDLNHPAVLVRG